jgi:5-methylcytosine-specific restriction enzyme B
LRTYRVCLPGWTEGSAFPQAALSSTFAVGEGEKSVSLYVLGMEEARSLTTEQRDEYLAALDYCAGRLDRVFRSPYRRAHVPALADAVFDEGYREELLLYGFAGKPKPPYTVEQCAEETGFSAEEIKRWLSGIERKKQAIIYGPPGTGKTFVAQRLAKVLTSGGAGVSDIVQFHPAYAYEDFIQGIRPMLGEEGALTYDLVPGRFLDFCAKAAETKDISVLIIDEVNRANLSRVFGELMYLLEYRDQEIPLAAGGTLRIPENVRIIGTMNTADRSIALVDHALRRRFAFIALYPNWDVLRLYHRSHNTGFPVEQLIAVLAKLNKEIGDNHYAIGISFFLKPDLGDAIADVWSMEIEPYLEEYFFDQETVVDRFRWGSIQASLGL